MPIILERGISVDLNRSAQDRLFSEIAARLVPRFKDAFEKYAFMIIGELPAEGNLRQRTGKMIKALITGTKSFGSTLASVRLRVNATKAGILQEFGGTVMPLEGQWLAIPVLFGLRPDGSPKRMRPSSWSSYGVFTFKSKDQRLFLAYRTADGQLRVIYRLIEQIKVKARLGFNKRFDQKSGVLIDMFASIIRQELAKVDWYNESSKGYFANVRKSGGVTRNPIRRIRLTRLR